MQRSMTTLALAVILGGLVLGASGRLFDADAMPPYPGLADQSPQLAAAVGHYNELRATFAERGICTPGNGLATGVTASGPFNVLAVCVRFTDHDSSVAATYFDHMLFDQSAGTMWDYYDEISYGNLSLITVDLPSSIGWQAAPSTYAYYVNNNYGFGSYPQNSQKLCEDIVDLINPLVDFSNYDNDGNGYVDGLIITHTGSGAELTGQTTDIWSHKWGISPRLRDGVYISTYTVQPEYWISPGDMTIGVYAHETGHMFGLPDLYDTDNSSRGLGKWSLMSNGSWNGSLGNSPAHPDAWCRTELGFCTPTVVNGSISGANLPSIESTPTLFRLWEDGSAGNQYFLVENRQKTGFDAGLPGAGLLIWHIDESKTSNTKEWYPGHTSSGNYLVALEQADGLWELEKNLDYGDTGDPFPGSTNKTFFSAASTPSSDDYSGTATYVTITNISSSSSNMTCDFTVSLETGIGDDQSGDGSLPTAPVVNYPNPFNPTTVVSYSIDRAADVTLAVYDILGRRIATLIDGAQEPGVHSVEWNGRDEHGHEAASGVYFARLESGVLNSVRKMVLVR